MVMGVSVTAKAVDQIIQHGFAFLDASAELQEAMQCAFNAGEIFFSSDMDSKILNRLPLDTGYRPYGQEYSQSSTRPDEVESFTVSYRTSDAASRLSGAEASILHTRMLSVFDIFDGAAEEITSRLALNFNRDPSEMKAAFTKWSLLQFNYSRPSQATADFINDLHEDGCLLTLMSIAGAGLELKTEAGFARVNPSSEKILVMAGEILWLLTGGRINPIYHRVRTVPSYQARRSLLFFADMSPSICSPWVRNQINEGINIGNKVLQNSSRFGLSEWIAED